LFALARALGEAWPGEASRAALIARTFRIRRPDETHRARLRVEIGRLRAALSGLADVRATSRGFELVPAKACEVVVLARPVDEEHAAVQALLADGEAWATSALALALGASQRSVQRALSALAEAGQAESYGKGRARRWIATPVPGITTTLLLPAPLPGD
jgi:DNA-binding transcriptional ArsR family regulator